jgi:uncharacterized protein (DUF362 family)
VPDAVVITPAEKLNYMHNYVALPYDYGRPAYCNRLDVKAIRKAVFYSLDTLDSETSFKDKFKGRQILVKPNLVGVMRAACYTCGYDIPQTTDPRVFDALIAYLKQLTDAIIIGESGGVTTRAGFKEAGYDRIARYYGARLVPFEEQPLDRYYVPKAEVQKEVFLPRIMSGVVRGEMLYVSVPKMKTNLYTEVTLGFKNAMGTLPSNMRYRNHTWQIEKKLTDLLYLFKPDLTVVDGIIGGEGLTPGPIDPVRVGRIVTGTNSVEVDRVVTRMMGFDPAKNNLIAEADKRGFGDPCVKVIGDMDVVTFRPADASLLSDRFRKNWPGVFLYVGHGNARAPKVHDKSKVSPETVKAIEQSCRGGCLATLAMCMEMFLKGKKATKGLKLAVVLGNGVDINGIKYWFDGQGRPYDLAALKTIKERKICVGGCSKPAAEVCHIVAHGCGNVAELVKKLMKATRLPVPMLSMENDGLPLVIVGLIQKYFNNRRLVKSGEIVDIPPDAFSDNVVQIPELSEKDKKRDWIQVPMKFTKEQIRENLKNLKFAPL